MAVGQPRNRLSDSPSALGQLTRFEPSMILSRTAGRRLWVKGEILAASRCFPPFPNTGHSVRDVRQRLAGLPASIASSVCQGACQSRTAFRTTSTPTNHRRKIARYAAPQPRPCVKPVLPMGGNARGYVAGVSLVHVNAGPTAARCAFPRKIPMQGTGQRAKRWACEPQVATLRLMLCRAVPLGAGR